MKILCINGTYRTSYSHTRAMTAAVADAIATERPDWEFREVLLRTVDLQSCQGATRCFRKGDCVTQDGAEDLIKEFLAADGVILASPNYAAMVTTLMKTFIERSTRISHRKLMRGKTGMGMSTSASPFDGDHAAVYLRNTLISYGASVVPPCNIGGPMIFDYGDTPAGDQVRTAVREFVAAVEHPEQYVPEETFGTDMMAALKEFAVARRVFRSDREYFRTKGELVSPDAAGADA